MGPTPLDSPHTGRMQCVPTKRPTTQRPNDPTTQRLSAHASRLTPVAALFALLSVSNAATAQTTRLLDHMDLGVSASRASHAVQISGALRYRENIPLGTLIVRIAGVELSAYGSLSARMKTQPLSGESAAIQITLGTLPENYGKRQAYQIRLNDREVYHAIESDPGGGPTRSLFLDAPTRSPTTKLEILADPDTDAPVTITTLRVHATKSAEKEVGSRKPEVGSRKTEDGRTSAEEVGSRKPEIGSRMSEVGRTSKTPEPVARDVSSIQNPKSKIQNPVNPQSKMALSLVSPKGGGYEIDEATIRDTFHKLPLSSYLTDQLAILYNFSVRNAAENAAEIDRLAALAEQTRIPLRIAFQVHWGGIPRGVSDGAGGTFTDLP